MMTGLRRNCFSPYLGCSPSPAVAGMTERGPGQDRRKFKRLKKRLSVQFGPGELAHSGYTQEVSEGGLCLHAGVLYPPNTVLLLQIEYAEGTVTTRGVVRWVKDLPPAFKRSLRGGMGIEFLQPAGARLAAAAAESPSTMTSRPAPRQAGVPPGASEQDLENGSTSRRQVSTMGGNTFEILQTEYLGAWYVRIFQLPHSDGSAEAVFREAFWSRETARAAVKGFLKGQ